MLKADSSSSPIYLRFSLPKKPEPLRKDTRAIGVLASFDFIFLKVKLSFSQPSKFACIV